MNELFVNRLRLRLRICWLGSVGLLLGGAFLISPAEAHAESDDDFFESKIRPILTERCLNCHSTEKGKSHGGLALDTQQGWEKGGESGPAITPGDIDSSLLIRAVRYGDDGAQMPPEEAGGKLPDTEIALLKQWVRQGAHDPRTGAAKRGGMTEEQLRSWWSFQPLKPVSVPTVNQPGLRNETDHFLRARLTSEGLEASPEADRRTLIRRVTYDLTGLPPSPEEVDAFLADTSSSAYETVVERLLQSSHYGEHWGRHWLDVVRYADTAGENTDHPIPDAWRYRNWVIDAFNRDLPYDQFVREQIAGDLIHANDPADQYAAGIVSTGFLAIARRFDHDSDKFMHLTFEDAIDTMGQSFLGLTVDPSENYGADSTLIECEIAEIDGQERIWNLTRDVVSDFFSGNPHADGYGNAATWLFLDGRGGPSLLSESVQNSAETAGLHVWRTGDNPAVFVNSTEQPLHVWASLPPKTLFVHPAQDGPVALGWVSPIAGRVQIRGHIADAHPGGPNGVGWRIDHYIADVSAGVQQMAKTNVLKT